MSKKLARAVTWAEGPGGRRTVSKSGLELVERLATEGVDNLTIAKQLRMSGETFRNLRKRQPDVQEALDNGRSALSDELTHILLTHARKGNVVAAIFLAKARCGWREGDAPEQRNNIVINLPDAQSPEAYMQLLGPRPLPSPGGKQ